VMVGRDVTRITSTYALQASQGSPLEELQELGGGVLRPHSPGRRATHLALFLYSDAQGADGVAAASDSTPGFGDRLEITTR
jgi:hypothetical protein